MRPVDQPADAPSAEGPRVNTAPQSFSFRTFGPLRVTEHRCGWREGCSPFDPWTIKFSNPIDGSMFQQSQVRVEEISAGKKSHQVSLKSAVYDDTLNIGGDNTTYDVIVKGESYGPTPTNVSEICRDMFEEDGLPEEVRLITSNEQRRTKLDDPSPASFARAGAKPAAP